MDDLFRWMTVRAPQPADSKATVALTGPEGSTAFQDRLSYVLHPDGPPPPADPWPPLVALARQYQDSDEFAGSSSALLFAGQLEEFGRKVRDFLAKPLPADVMGGIDGIIEGIFDLNAFGLSTSANFKRDWTRIHDSIVALFIAPTRDSARINTLTNLARLIALIARVAAADASLDTPGVAAAALSLTLLLPPLIFPINRRQVKPVGIADLLVVRQHIARYELADISSIENVLKGESKKHLIQHTLTAQQETTDETETTTVTEEELQTDERFDLKNEVSSVLKTDLSVKAGAAVTYTYGEALTVKTKLDVAYDKAQSDSAKISRNYAKDVTARAAAKVTERVLSRQSHKITEVVDEQDELGFTAKDKNITGIYQWLTKVYTAQIFNYGKRLLFDITVPEPASFLLDAVSTQADGAGAERPDPFLLAPHDLVHDNPGHPNYYGTFIAKYGVRGFDTAPPEPRRTVVKGISLRAPNPDDMRANPCWSGDLPIPAGYSAETVRVNGRFNGGRGGKGKFEGFRVTVGSKTFVNGWYVGSTGGVGWLTGATPTPASPGIAKRALEAPADNEEGSIPLSVSTQLVIDCSLIVEVVCALTETGLDAWKLKAHQAIQQAYNKLESDYAEQVAAGAVMPEARAHLGGNPEENRQIERTELKKAAIQIMSGRELVAQPLGSVWEAATPPPDQPNYPRTDFAAAVEQARFIRFFEQAFEWENLSYVFYPYYWAQPRTWRDLALLEHDDPLFAAFLGAGGARVVIPVRPALENDVRYFLLTGQIWGGGDLPGVSDADYLPIAEEIKAATGAPASEAPQGDPWLVRVPANLVCVRSKSTLPEWTRSGDWDWSSS